MKSSERNHPAGSKCILPLMSLCKPTARVEARGFADAPRDEVHILGDAKTIQPCGTNPKGKSWLKPVWHLGGWPALISSSRSRAGIRCHRNATVSSGGRFNLGPGLRQVNRHPGPTGIHLVRAGQPVPALVPGRVGHLAKVKLGSGQKKARRYLFA